MSPKKTELSIEYRKNSSKKLNFDKTKNFTDLEKLLEEKLVNIPVEFPSITEISNVLSKFKLPAMKQKAIAQLYYDLEEKYPQDMENDMMKIILSYLYDELSKIRVFSREEYEYQEELQNKYDFLCKIIYSNFEPHEFDYFDTFINKNNTINEKSFESLKNEIDKLIKDSVVIKNKK